MVFFLSGFGITVRVSILTTDTFNNTENMKKARGVELIDTSQL